MVWKTILNKISFKWEGTGITWGGPQKEWYHIYWWNPLSKGHRYIGPWYMWYDGPHYSFGFWYCNISWDFPWSKYPGDDKMHVDPWVHDWHIWRDKEKKDAT